MSLWLGGLGGYSLCNLTLKKNHRFVLQPLTHSLKPFTLSSVYGFSHLHKHLFVVSPFFFYSPLLSTGIFALSALLSFLNLISQFISSSFHSLTCSRLFSFISCFVHSFANQLLIFPFTCSVAHLLCFFLAIFRHFIYAIIQYALYICILRLSVWTPSRFRCVFLYNIASVNSQISAN